MRTFLAQDIIPISPICSLESTWNSVQTILSTPRHRATAWQRVGWIKISIVTLEGMCTDTFLRSSRNCLETKRWTGPTGQTGPGSSSARRASFLPAHSLNPQGARMGTEKPLARPADRHHPQPICWPDPATPTPETDGHRDRGTPGLWADPQQSASHTMADNLPAIPCWGPYHAGRTRG